jgi:hypothetical protein
LPRHERLEIVSHWGFFGKSERDVSELRAQFSGISHVETFSHDVDKSYKLMAVPVLATLAVGKKELARTPPLLLRGPRAG